MSTTNEPRTDRLESFASKAVSVVIVVLATIAAYRFVVPASSGSQPVAEAPIPKDVFAFADGPVLGSNDAAAVMVEFSDFECPFCRQYAIEVWPRIQAEFLSTGKLLVAFKHFPLPMHKYAKDAAVAAECAAKHGRFWEMHDQLFSVSPAIAPAALPTIAVAAGIDRSSFERCDARVAESRVAADTKLAGQLRIGGTPTFILGRREGPTGVRPAALIDGARPFKDFKAAIEKILGGS